MPKLFYMLLIVVALTITWYAIIAGIGCLVMVTTGYILHVSPFVPLILGVGAGMAYLLFTGRTEDD